MKRVICTAASLTVLWLIGAESATAANTLCVGATPGCFATIQAAVDAASSGDTIRVGAGTYAGGITITKSVQLVGVSAAATVVKGGGPVVTIGQFEGDNGGLRVGISRLTITGGVVDTPGNAGGGGISIPQSRGQATGATVTIDDSVISDNRAAPVATFSDLNPGPCFHVPQNECAFASSGGIANAGNLALTRTFVLDNVAGSPGITHYAFGGGITNNPQGTLSLKWSVVSGNRATVSPPDGRFSEGGGIEDFGTMTIAFSQITGNSSVVVSSVPSSILGNHVEQNADAGGVDLSSRGTATVDSSTISGNTVSDFDSNGDAQAFNGGIDDDGTLVLTASIVDRNTVSAGVPDGSGFVAAANSGGVGLTGTASVQFSHIGGNSLEANSANGLAFAGGAGVGDFSGHLSVDRSLITGNSGSATSGADTIALGGGILETSFGGPEPQVTITDTVVVANRLTGTAGTPEGGGIFNGGLGGGGPYPLTVARSVIQGNSPDPVRRLLTDQRGRGARGRLPSRAAPQTGGKSSRQGGPEMKKMICTAACATLLGVTGSGAATPGTAASPLAANQTGYPSSMLVIGHSGLTGFGSNPRHPFQDATANSWATGTNPAVGSIYTRLLAINPAIKGRAMNFARDGATLAEFAGQVGRAVGLKTRPPDLVIVDIGGNDMKCDGQDESRFGTFRADFAASLQKLANGLPSARIFVVGQNANYDGFVKAMMHLSLAARLTHASKGLCSIFAPQSAPSPGSVVPAHLSYVKKIMDGIDSQLAAACSEIPRCTYDGDASRHLNGTAADLTSRYDHLSITGLAKVAALEWAAMVRMHVIPG